MQPLFLAHSFQANAIEVEARTADFLLLPMENEKAPGPKGTSNKVLQLVFALKPNLLH